MYNADYIYQIGKGIILRPGTDITLIGTGSILNDIMTAADILAKEGIAARVINMHTIKPIDREIILQAAEETKGIITIEDHNIIGGLGSAVAEVITEAGTGILFKRLGLQSFSNGYGTYAQVKETNGIGINQIISAVRVLLKL